MSSAAPILPLRGATAPVQAWPASLRVCVLPTLAAAAWQLVLLVGYAAVSHGDPSAFVCVDGSLAGRWPYEAVRVGFETGGFDGQQYYALARDPWHVRGAPIDFPAYRHARILYPALGWIMSGGGHPVRLLWVLPTINLLAVAGLAWLGARLAVHHGRSAWWGFLLPLVVNAGLPALRDLTDPLAALTVCGLLTAWLLRWPPWVVFAWAAAAVLSREQNAAVVLIVLLGALAQRQWRYAAGLAAAVLCLAGWLMGLRAAYGVWPFAQETVGAPFAGLLNHWPLLRSDSRGYLALHVAGLLTLAVQAGLCVILGFFRVPRSVKLVALAGLLLAAVGGAGLYSEEWNYLRVFTWMPLAVWLGSLLSDRRWPIVLLSPTALWPVIAVVRAWPK